MGSTVYDAQVYAHLPIDIHKIDLKLKSSAYFRAFLTISIYDGIRFDTRWHKIINSWMDPNPFFWTLCVRFLHSIMNYLKYIKNYRLRRFFLIDWEGLVVFPIKVAFSIRVVFWIGIVFWIGVVSPIEFVYLIEVCLPNWSLFMTHPDPECLLGLRIELCWPTLENTQR